MAAIDDLPPETIRRLKRRYANPAETLAAIAADEGLEPKDLQALQRTLGWKTRAARKAAAATTKRPARAAGKRAVSKKAAVTKKAAPKARAAGPEPAPGQARKRDAPPPVPPPGAVDMPTLIARIRAQLEAALRTAQAQGDDKDPEETARLMNSLTRTLQMLSALEKDTNQDGRQGDGSDVLPLDLAELRRELARRIDLLRDDREGA